MRTKTQFTEDTYYLGIAKKVSVFIMIAYGFFNEIMMAAFGPLVALIAVIFMFVPRVIINDLLDEDEDGTREIEKTVIPEWMHNFNLVLNIIKFVCLVILTLYTFLNKEMMEFGGIFLIWIVFCFMIIPRKLIITWEARAHE